MRSIATTVTCALVLLVPCTAWAVTVVFSDFSSSAGLVVNGNAQANVNNGIDAGRVLRLVPATGTQSGSAFSQTQLNASNFSTFFKFRITNPGGAYDGFGVGADGLVFVVQPVSASIGGAGGGMGYQGVSPSLGVEFDTWWNGWDPDSNHVGVDLNGSMTSAAVVSVAPSFDDSNLWYAWVDYNGTTLEVRANQSGTRPGAATLAWNVNLPSVIGTTSAYIGFTAGTGASWGNHDIVSWEYRDEFDPIPGAIPEPVTLAGLCCGLASLGAYVRRRTV